MPRASMRDRTERQVATPIEDVAAGFLKKTDIPKSKKTLIGKTAKTVEREKTSLSLSVEAKFKLSTLKADLRRQGHRITESMIVEMLIQKASGDELFPDSD